MKPNTISIRRRQLVIAGAIGAAIPGSLLAGQFTGGAGLLESPTPGGTIMRERKLILSGRVLDGAGNPVRGATIEAAHADARPTVTDADGRFMLVAGRAPATMKMRVSHPHHRTENLNVDLSRERGHVRDLHGRVQPDEAGAWRATLEVALA